MSKSEAWALYVNEVRSALGRPLDGEERDHMRQLWELDVDAEEAAREIQRETTANAMRLEGYEREVLAGPTNHLLRIC